MKYRIALYSHDTMGMGHMRRNALIARAFADAFPASSTLLICGAVEAQGLDLPPRTDCLTLPAIRKEDDGAYAARRLDLSTRQATMLRGKAIRGTLSAFAPHLLIVDKVPRGVGRELDSTLRALRARGGTRCVLGLRDILDEPVATRREWLRAESEDAVREYYDAVWIYGDPSFFDPVREYGFSEDVATKARHTGFLDQRVLRGSAPSGGPSHLCGRPYVLCMVGGGEDGVALARAFAEADFPRGTSGVLVTGAFMPDEARQSLKAIAARRADLEVTGFVQEPSHLVAAATRVVTMGGYNGVGEVLCNRKRALIVPRVHPRQEQLMRAERLHALGLAEMLHPECLTPRALSDWMSGPATPPPDARTKLDFGGLQRLPRLLEEVLAEPRMRLSSPLNERRQSLVAY